MTLTGHCPELKSDAAPQHRDTPHLGSMLADCGRLGTLPCSWTLP